MKVFILIILTVLFVTKINGQISFSQVDSKLEIIKEHYGTQVQCSGSTISVSFYLNDMLTVMPKNNFVTIDSQVILVTPLIFSGYHKDSLKKSLNNQKELLSIYSNYEMEYFKNDLGIEVLHPNSQWVLSKSKGWYIWYFRMGDIPTKVDKQMRIQLFASTVIGDNILTINAPIMDFADFTKTGLIVNEMMETMTITQQ